MYSLLMFTQSMLGLTFEDVQCSRLITVASTVASYNTNAMHDVVND